jgi:hypothetical protein
MPESYPDIKANEKAQNSRGLRADETGIATNGNLVRGYATVGKTTELRLNNSKEHSSMILAIKKRTLRFILYEEDINSKWLMEFLTRLLSCQGYSSV